MDAETKLHQSVTSPVSVAVVNTLAKQPSKLLKTKKAESWPVVLLLKIL
jgi:hypothetical protein